MDDQLGIETFKQAFRGDVIGSGDTGYDEARSLYNGMIDKRPLLIARCTDVADVITAVNFGRSSGLPVAVRGGGHNGPGLGSVDDGLVIDLSPMKGVRVDPEANTVRVGGGCTTGDVDHATHAFGQAVPFGIISTTGVAGLTLSGGHGYLSRQYGLAVDNLLEADVVLADGRFVVASESKNADLFWAIRGGGGNFGVVTSFLFRTNPAKILYGGPIAYAIEDAEAVMRWYRDFTARKQTDFYIFLGLQGIPPVAPFPEAHWNKKMCVLLVAHNGAAGEAAVNAIRNELPKPLFDWCGPIPYTALQQMFDPFYPRGLNWYWKGDFVKTLPDDAIAAHVAHATKANVFSAMHLYPIDGAVHTRKSGDMAWGTRDALWSMVIVGLSPDAADRTAVRDWATAYWRAVHPYDLAGAYPNFMMADEGEGRIHASFGSNYEKLARIKKTYDPTNFFRVNQNIPPA
jgi:FAD/FMN-containing dehydrogenase